MTEARAEETRAPLVYRYERKFLVEHVMRWEAEDALLWNRAHFAPLYHPRWINNIYLDTPEWTSFQENRSGDAGPRAKTRIRWYGDYRGVVERPVLEVKIRDGYVNRKRSFPLAPMKIDDGLSWQTLLDVFAASDLSPMLELELGRLQPALGNRYFRSYFLSESGRLRATVDSDIAYLPLRRSGNLLSAFSSDWETLIIELKYELDADLEGREAAQQLPFRLTRSSKYAAGVARVAA
jgi:hypothetical protein